MKKHDFLLSAAAIATIGALSGPAQAAAQDRTTSNASSPRTVIVDPTGVAIDPDSASAAEIVVVGIRGSVTSASEKKRKSKQIVDSVVAEDAGKLPDNNVPEALARISGVQITRARGQGQSVAIRGLEGIQTTVNGNNANQGAGRSLNLADVPAELIKAVDVYKTRTADQIEGSIAGTVNIELRRPLDLAKGMTIAGSARGAYDNLSEKVSPFLSALVGYRFETGIGEMGFLVNGSWARQNFFETYVQSESPSTVCCENDENSSWARLPVQFRNVIVPFAARSGLEEGYVERPSLSGSFQWAPSSSLQFTLEGVYSGAREEQDQSRYYAILRDYGSTLSNIQLQPDGITANRVTLSGARGQVPVGIDNLWFRRKSDFYQVNGEMRWTSDRATLTVTGLYSRSNNTNYNIQHLPRPPALSQTTVDFTTKVGGYNVPVVRLDGIDLSNIANYGLERFQDLRGTDCNEEFVSQADLTLMVSEDRFLRTLQFGFRANRRDVANRYGYRDGFPRVGDAPNAFAPLSQLPGADRAELVGPKISGAQKWLRIPGRVLLANMPAIREYMQETSGTGPRFVTEFPSSDLGQEYTSTENTFAIYGQLNWSADLKFPIDGNIGLRYVNTFGGSQSTQFVDSNNGVVTSDVRGRGNFIDLLPSANAVIHFTPSAQLRLAYSTNVQRPGFAALRPFFYVDPRGEFPTVYAGNPDLKAQKSNAYDVSAEYFFGKGGQLTLTGFYKTASDFLYYDRRPLDDLGRYGFPGRRGFIEQEFNGGDGEFIGVEGTAQSFFDFLPGKFANFGASVNGAHMIKARVEYPYPEDFPGAFDSADTSKWTLNTTLFYDTPAFSARLAFNYRSPFRGFPFFEQPAYTTYTAATHRLDAAVNYTPLKWITLSLEATNLTGNDVYQYFGKENLLGSGVRIQARTVQASARVRF